MTLDLEQPIATLPETAPERYRAYVLSGKLVSFRYLLSWLRRRRRVWIAAAIGGLIIGSAFHLVVPRQYDATATIYLAHAPGTNDLVEIGNDLALLNNTAVARKAIAILNEPSLDPLKFLGKSPGKALSDNVVSVSLSGPSYQEAVRRVNAVTTGYLAFRARQFNAQDEAILHGLDQQIGTLQSQVSALTTSINAASTGSDELTQLVTQRLQDGTEIENLQQTAEVDRLNTLSIVQASRVLTSGTPVSKSWFKVAAVDGLTGLGVGLALGLGIVLIQALVSDRVRRREDVSVLTGAPVDVSASPVRQRERRSLSKKRTLASSVMFAQRPNPELLPVVRYLMSQVRKRMREGLLVVAMDRVDLIALALNEVAASLAREHKRVVLIDLTDNRIFESFYQCAGAAVQRVKIRPDVSITLFSPQRDLGPEDDRAAWELSANRWRKSDVVLALATIDIGRGASHLRQWNEAVLSVTAGCSTPQRISTIAELLRASGVLPISSILFEADSEDESLGLAFLAGSAASSPTSDMFASTRE